MGHHSRPTRQILEDLIARLNKYQVGAPATREMFEILSLLFKEEEAYIGSRFPLGPATIKKLAKKTARPPQELEPVLESMASKGLVMDQEIKGKKTYILTPTIFGFFEFTFMRLNKDLPYKELARLMEKIFQNEMGPEVFDSKTAMSRTLVHERALSSITSRVASYDKASEIIKAADSWAVQNCFCRQKVALLGESCPKKAPLDVCMALGWVADFLVRRGFGRSATRQEMLAILDETEKLGLVHVTDNVRDDPQFICHCCGCCCEMLSGASRRGFEKGVEPSRYRVKVDPDKCSGCGLCVEICQVKTLSFDSDNSPVVQVAFSKCIGCGVCISCCAHEALSLVERQHAARTPKNYLSRHTSLTWEKGRFHHSLSYMVGAAFSGELLSFLKITSKNHP